MFEFLLVLLAGGGIAGYLQLKSRMDALERGFAKMRRDQASAAEAAVPAQPLPVQAAQEAPAAASTFETAPMRVPESAPVSPPSGPSDLSSLADTVKRNLAGAAVVIEALLDEATPSTSAPAPAPAAATRTAKPAVPSALSQAAETLFGLVKKNPFASLGVLLMLVGVGFLFSLLAVNDILPPAVRVALVALAGAGVFGMSFKQEKLRQALALNLQGGALAVEFLCALWAYQGYELVSSATAFAWMGALSAFAVGWAAYKRRALFAFMGIAGSLLTPILTSTGQGEFSGLTAYCLWVSVLGVGVGLYLRMPSLVSTALAGVSLLLGGAVSIAPGNTSLSALCLVLAAILYSGTALNWTRAKFDFSARAQASILAVLTGAPLITAGFLYGCADVSAKGCAVLIAAASLAYLATMAKAPAAWKAELFCIGASLGLVALGVGFEGASRALAISAAAMGLVRMARSLKTQWADAGAMIYWVVSVAFSVDNLQHGNALSAMPLAISGAVALAAGFFYRGVELGIAYTMLAPLVLAAASVWGTSNQKFALLAWFLVWAPAAIHLGKLVRWSDLRLSSVWVLYAGFWAFAGHPDAAPGQLALRELLLLSWFVASAWVADKLDRDSEVPLCVTVDAAANFSLLFPVLGSVEMVRVLGVLHVSDEAMSAALLLLWAGWYVAARVFRAKGGFDAHIWLCGRVALALGVLDFLFDSASFAAVSEWLALAAVALTLRIFPSETPKRAWTVVASLAGAVLLGSVLRALGLIYGLHEGVAELLVAKAMQPWVSVLWAAASISVVAFASHKRKRRLWMGAGLSVLVLIAKMLLVDLDALSLVAKVVVFMVTGLGFVALGYFCPLPPEDDQA